VTTTPDPAAVSPGGRAEHTSPTGEPLYGPQFAADPAATYERLRKHGPAGPVELAPGVRAMLVTGYEAALEVLRSPETYSKDSRRWRELADGTVPADSPVLPMMVYRPNALVSDGDEHHRLRGVITDSLGRVDPNALRSYVEQSADTLIDQFAPSGRADLLGDYAKILPLLVFNRLFGCPPDYGDQLVVGMTGIFDGVEAEKANALVTRTMVDLVALKRATPGPDVTSWLMAHPARLSDEEIIHTLVLLMGAGTEPEQNLIANGLRLLLSDDRFAGSLSGGSLPVEDALDDVLWADPPMANYGVHFPVRDARLGDVRLPAGSPVVISFAAANTDPSLASDQRSGNCAHLAWSAGPHTCPAQSSARLIAAVAIEKLLDRLPDVALAVPVGDLMWRPGPFHRALTALPVHFPPVPVPGRADQPSGAGRPEAAVGASAPPAPSASAPAAAPQRPAPAGPSRTPLASAGPGPRHRWSSLVAWWRGR
jgi:cytochrome P450